MKLNLEAVFWCDNEAGLLAIYEQTGKTADFIADSLGEGIAEEDIKELLGEAGITPAKPRRRRATKAKRFSYQGRERTVSEILSLSGSRIAPRTFRDRVSRGMSVEEALTVPVMDRSQIARLGAQAANSRRR